MYCVGSKSKIFRNGILKTENITLLNFNLFFSLQDSRGNCMDSLKGNDCLGFSKSTVIPSLEKVTEIKVDGKPFSPRPPWQLQNNEPAASAWSLRQPLQPNIVPSLRQRERSSAIGLEHRRCRMATKLIPDFSSILRNHLKPTVPWSSLFWHKRPIYD